MTDIRAILKNLVTQGPVKTYRIHQERDAKRQEKQRHDEYLQDIVKRYSDRLDVCPDAASLKAVVTRQVIPEVYASESQKPVEHKVILMERGARLSGSFTFLKSYLEQETDYIVVSHRLGSGQVSQREYYERALAYIADCATAEAVFNCTANDLMGYICLRSETTYIQLWHGCGIMKKVGLSTIGHSFGKSAQGHKEYPLNTNYTYVTLASPEQEWIYEEAMGLDASTGMLVSTGVSRTDVFFDEAYLEQARQALCAAVPFAKDKKVILYAPTFRGEVAQAQGPDELDLCKMAQVLGDEYVLVIKHHQSVKATPEIPAEVRDSFAFDLTRGKGVNINQLLATADICISDYSSIVFEYSLFERPMAFFTYDIDDYIDERGLYYRLDELLPGPLLSSTDEIIDFVQNVDERFDRQLVRDFKERFMRNCDGHSTERIVNLIGTKPQARR